MGLDPSLHEQTLIAETLERNRHTLSPAERRAEAVVSGGFVLAVVVLLVAFPPASTAWDAPAAIACFIALVVALHAKFDMGSGFTVPSQLAFVPLLFTVPPSLAPIVVVLALVVAYLPDVVRGKLRPVRMLRFLGDGWFAIGPAVVLSAAGPITSAPDTAAVVLAAALAAQLACDFGASVVMEQLVRGTSVREQLRETWVYAVDIALTPVALLVAWHVDAMPWAVLSVVPLLGVLAVFGRERRGRVEGLVELNNAYRGTALLLGNVLEADDFYTAEHSRGVVELALAIGRRLELDDGRLRNLEFAALLHDVGKVAIPKEIINKPGELNPHEWQIIKTHTLEGQRMLDTIGGFMSDVGHIVRSHHERWDGTGYPDELAGEAIPIEARIITACDSWNAMTTTRPYRAALGAEVARDELQRCAGTQFDPTIVPLVLDAVSAADLPAPETAPPGEPVTAAAVAPALRRQP
jgi:HD-GYP domain-containing protein (c-di-GMP phosphodiesterase class II)